MIHLLLPYACFEIFWQTFYVVILVQLYASIYVIFYLRITRLYALT